MWIRIHKAQNYPQAKKAKARAFTSVINQNKNVIHKK